MEYHAMDYHAPFDLFAVNILQFDNFRHSDVLPLWSSKNLRLRDEEYYNFEIRDGSPDCDSDDGVQDYSSYTEIETNIPKSMCHICNIEVPLGYMRLHQNSEKHKIHVKISDIALERVRRQMAESYTTENINPSMYFCQSCVVLVHIKDKELHLASNIHKNSICIDKLLIDFSKLYSDEEIDRQFENDMEIVSKTSQFIKESVNSDIAILEEKTVTKPLIIEPNKLSLDENYKHVIDHLNTEVFKCNIKYLNQQQLIIITEENIKLKVNHDNFHGFLALGSKHVQCKLCGQITKNIREHMYEDGHLMKLALPIDKNCIRKIKDSKAHCIVCNELVENPEIHSLSVKAHDRLMTSAMVNEQDETDSELKKETPNYYFCNVCHMPVHNSDANIHLEDPKHTSNIKTEGYYLLEYSYSLRKLKCNVCFSYFPKNMMEDHLSNSSHISMYETLLASNYLDKSTKNIFCNLCILYFDIGDEINHIKSPGHLGLLKAKNSTKKSKTKKNKQFTETKDDEQKNDVKDSVKKSINSNVGRVIEDDSKKKSNENLVTCKICDVTMQDTQNDIKNHLLVYHQIEDVKTVIENSKMKSVGSSLMCESCCEYVTVKDKLKHLSNPTHIVRSFKNTNNEKIIQLPNTTIKNDDKNNNELNKKMKDIFVPKKEKIDTKKPIHCPICDSTVPNGVNSMKIHEIGKKHNANLQAILLKNNIEVRSDHLRCTVCCMDIEKKELIPHINSDYHTCVEEKSKKTVTISYCDLCNKCITTSMERHVLSAAHKSKENPKNVASFMCFVCDVLLTNSELNIREHNEGIQHKNNIKILNDNTIKVSDDKCYCDTCDVNFTFKMIKPHINSSQHLILMGNDMQQ